MNKNEKHNRRKFLSLGLLSGAAMIAAEVTAESLQPSANDEETVMLLTPDGKLVEVKKSIVQGARSGSKVSNQNILQWTKSNQSK